MTFTQTPVVVDGKRAFRYVFETCGDQLPVHAHVDIATFGGAHDVRCVAGSLEVEMTDNGEKIPVPLSGEPLQFDCRRPHTVRALSDRAECVNVYINDQIPDNYPTSGETP